MSTVPRELMERGHPVRLRAQREQPLNDDTMQLSLLRTLADRDVRAPSPRPVLTPFRE